MFTLRMEWIFCSMNCTADVNPEFLRGLSLVFRPAKALCSVFHLPAFFNRSSVFAKNHDGFCCLVLAVLFYVDQGVWDFPFALAIKERKKETHRLL